jgi:hypothetical protein
MISILKNMFRSFTPKNKKQKHPYRLTEKEMNAIMKHQLPVTVLEKQYFRIAKHPTAHNFI